MQAVTTTRLGITLGDPAGIGPEVVLGALRALCETNALWPEELQLFGPANVAWALVEALQKGPTQHAALAARMRVIGGPNFMGPMGRASAESGKAALDALHAAMAAAQSGAVHALTTAPINKSALALAQSADRGHTEILGRHLAVGPYAMAFFSPTLQVVLTSVHVALAEAIAKLSTQRVVDVAKLLHAALLQKNPNQPAPRIALAGLNPHASEGGMMGHEEATILAPAVHQARQLGIALSDPKPPDTVFLQAHEGHYDGVVALYHDQGLIPVKLLAFGRAVNVTLGLRVPRTSPDHGTAYDRVGTHTAHCGGMHAAIEAAIQLAQEKSPQTKDISR